MFRIVDLPPEMQVYGGGMGSDPSEWRQTTESSILLNVERNGRITRHRVSLPPGVRSELAYVPSGLQGVGLAKWLLLPGSVQYQGGREHAAIVLGGGLLVAAGTALTADFRFRSLLRDYEAARVEYADAITEADAVRWREESEALYDRLGGAAQFRDTAGVVVVVVYGMGLLDGLVHHARSRFSVHEVGPLSLRPDLGATPGITLRLALP